MDEETTTLTMRPGARTTIRLPGLAVAGYRWTHHVEGDSAAVNVTVATAPQEQIDTRQPGAPTGELATIEALHPGRATVILEQRRSWEHTPTPQACRTITVTVT